MSAIDGKLLESTTTLWEAECALRSHRYRRLPTPLRGSSTTRCFMPRLANNGGIGFCATPRRSAACGCVPGEAGTGRRRCPYPEAVEEAICFGWIDSTSTILDVERGLQLFTPRRPKSPWTRLNRERAADMEQRGLMTDAGRQVIAVARSNGWWTISDSVEDLEEPPDLKSALDRDPPARSNWDGFPPSTRKQMLWWIVSAVRDVTRADRITQVVAAAADGRRARG